MNKLIVTLITPRTQKHATTLTRQMQFSHSFAFVLINIIIKIRSLTETSILTSTAASLVFSCARGCSPAYSDLIVAASLLFPYACSCPGLPPCLSLVLVAARRCSSLLVAVSLLFAYARSCLKLLPCFSLVFLAAQGDVWVSNPSIMFNIAVNLIAWWNT